MLPFPWQIGLLAVGLVLLMGLFLGLALGTLLSAALRRKRRYMLDGIAGMAGCLGAYWLSATSAVYAVQLNGVVVGWPSGTRWPSLWAWALEHGLLSAIIGCVLCIALGRALASGADRLRPSARLHRATAIRQ